MSVEEIREAKENGIKFKLFRSPLEIKDNGVSLACTENILREDGKVMTEIIEGKEEFFECDSTIIAISQSPRTYMFQALKT